MRTVQHLRWGSLFHDSEGRLALRCTTFDECPKGAFVEIYPLWGAPPVEVLPRILDVGLGTGWRRDAEAFHRSRKERWRVQEVYRTSGAVDFLLRVLKDPELGDAPIVARLHVSCKGRLNRPLQVWERDLPPLLAAALQNRPAADSGWAEEAPPHKREDFQAPGSPSGLPEE